MELPMVNPWWVAAVKPLVLLTGNVSSRILLLVFEAAASDCKPIELKLFSVRRDYYLSRVVLVCC